MFSFTDPFLLLALALLLTIALTGSLYLLSNMFNKEVPKDVETQIMYN